jgi:hypothetical protein
MFTFIFGSIAGLFHKWDLACIDNHIFRLHYRATVIILLTAIALVSFAKDDKCEKEKFKSKFFIFVCFC